MQDLTSMRAFDALHEHKSLTAAAKALNQPKSTVSRRVAQLEADIGQALTIRQGNRLTLTKAGEVFASYSRQMLELADESYEAIQGLNNQVSGELKIVCHPALMRGWLGKILNVFLNDNSKVCVTLNSELGLGREEPDLVFWVGEYANLAWRKCTLGHWYYTVYAAPSYLKLNHPINHPEDCKHHSWIDFGATRKEGLVITHPDNGVYFLEPMVSRLECDNLALQIDSIAHGNGIGLLPKSVAKGYLKHHQGNITECLPGWKTGPVDINYYIQMGRPSKRLLALLDVVKSHIPESWHRQ